MDARTEHLMAAMTQEIDHLRARVADLEGACRGAAAALDRDFPSAAAVVRDILGEA